MPNPLEGKTIVFTGTLQIKRAEAKEKAEACGAKVGASITAKTDIVVLGSDAGQKAAQAEAKGIDIWTEEQFVNAVSGKADKGKKAEPKKRGQASAGAAADVDDSKTKKAPAKKRGAAAAVAAKEEEEEEEEEKAKPAPKKSARGAKAAAEQQVKEEEEKPKPAPKKPARGAKAAAAPPAEEAEEEKPKPAPKKPARGAKAAAAPPAEEAEEEEAKPAETKGGKKRGAAKSEEVEKPAKKAATSGGDGGAASSADVGPRARKPDRCIPNGDALTVYEDYDVKLMFTDIGTSAIGNNKFYIIQVLQGNGKFHAWNRWGRLGENGQNQMQTFSNVQDAIKDFEKKFQQKTKNKWDNRHSFVRHPDKYQLVETEEGEQGDGDSDGALGRLSVAQINKGQAVLKSIRQAVESGKGAAATFIKLSSDFYSLIPTTSGRKAPERIDNEEILQAKENLLEFWLRMGFDDMKETDGATPIEGVMEVPLPPDLKAAASNISDPHSISSSVTRGAVLADSRAGGPVKPMDKELYASILLYTGNSIYAELNRVLRSENRKAALKYFKYLRMFLEAMECMPKGQRTLWRGVSVDLYDQYEPGKVITWWGVSSCTSDKGVAEAFMRGCGGNCTLLTLECKTAMDIQALSFYSHEKESLLAPGTQLKVLSRERDGKVAKIHVEEVGRALS